MSTPAGAPCDRCAHSPESSCRACRALRARLVALASPRRLSFVAVARLVGLPAEQVERLVELEEDRDRLDDQRRELASELLALAGEELSERERRQVSCLTHMPNAILRAQIAEAQERDPKLTVAALAERAGYTDMSHVKRLLGLAPLSDSRKNGVVYRGAVSHTIALEHAGRLVVALGLDPVDVIGL